MSIATIFAERDMNMEAVGYGLIGTIVLCVLFGALTLALIKFRNRPTKPALEQAEKEEWQNAINQGREVLVRLYSTVQLNPQTSMLYDQAIYYLDMAQFRLDLGDLDDAQNNCRNANMYMKQITNIARQSLDAFGSS